MRKLVLAAALLAVAGPAFAEGGCGWSQSRIATTTAPQTPVVTAETPQTPPPAPPKS